MTTREEVRPKRRMRSACNACHRGKLRCSGGTPCSSCYTSGRQCSYSLSDPLGRPKGGKNKHLDSQNPSQEQQLTSSSCWDPPVDSSDEASRGSHPEDDGLHPQQSRHLDAHRQREPNLLHPNRPRYSTFTHTTGLSLAQAFRGNMQAIGSSADLASLTDVVLAAESRPRTPQTPQTPQTTQSQQLADYFGGIHGRRDLTYLPRNNDNALRPAAAMDDIEMETNWQGLLQESWDSDVASELERKKPQPWSGRDSISWIRTLDAGNRQSSLQATEHSTADHSSGCTCIQTQTNLLSYLRDVENKMVTNMPLGVLLKASKRGLAAWAELVQCQRSCLGAKLDEVVALLVTLGLRKMLRFFEAYSHLNPVTNELSVPSEMLSSRVSSAASMTLSSRSSSAASVTLGEQAASLAIGEYLLEEGEQNMIGDMLAFQNLSRIRRMLSVLLDRVTAGVRGLPAKCENDLELVQDMLRKLAIVADLQGRALQRRQEAHQY